MTPAIKSAIAHAIEGAAAAATGNFVEAADAFVKAGLDLVPWTVLQQQITDEQARRQNAIAVQLEDEIAAQKFGKLETDE